MITIKLGHPSQLPHIEYQRDGATRSYFIDHNTLFNILQQNCVEVRTSVTEYQTPVFESPALPTGTVKYIALPDGKVMLMMEKKEFRHNVNYHGTIYEDVPFPNLLFVFILRPDGNGYTMHSKKLFAFKDKVFRDSTVLYKFPFSHVTADGSMCFFFMSKVNDLAQLNSFQHNWLAGEFSDHYYSGNGASKNKFNMPLRQIFNETKGKPFQYDKLLEDCITVSGIVNEITKMYFPDADQLA